MMWQALQPMFENTVCPLDTVVLDVEVLDVEADEVPAAAATAELAVAAATCVPDVEDVDEFEVADAAGVLEVAGVGGARKRMKAAKLTMSEEMPDARLTPLDWSVKLVVLSGKLLNWHAGFSSRSCG